MFMTVTHILMLVCVLSVILTLWLARSSSKHINTPSAPNTDDTTVRHLGRYQETVDHTTVHIGVRTEFKTEVPTLQDIQSVVDVYKRHYGDSHEYAVSTISYGYKHYDEAHNQPNVTIFKAGDILFPGVGSLVLVYHTVPRLYATETVIEVKL